MPLIEKAIGKIDSSESYHIRAIQDLHEIQKYYQCSEADFIAVILIATNNDKLKKAIKEGKREGHSLKEVLQMRHLGRNDQGPNEKRSTNCQTTYSTQGSQKGCRSAHQKLHRQETYLQCLQIGRLYLKRMSSEMQELYASHPPYQRLSQQLKKLTIGVQNTPKSTIINY